MIELDQAEVTAWVPDPAGGRDRTVRILGPVTLSLTERRVAVVGANGSGKSTLARLIDGLVLPSAGSVRVDGLDTARDGVAVRRRVGFLFTDPDAQVVMPTPAEDVALSLRRTPGTGAERRAAAHRWLDRFGLAAHADLPVHTLSAGQRQLLALAAPVARGSIASALKTMWRDARCHRSPNAGWPESAMAGALGVKLAGPRRYAEGLVDDPYLNADGRDAKPTDIRRALRMLVIACGIQLAIFAILTTLIGL